MIGVVASFLIPKIKLKYQEVTTVAKVRNVYSLLNASYQQAIRKYGPLKYWGLAEGSWELGDNNTTNNDDTAFFSDAEKLYSRLLDGLNAENVSKVLPLQATNYMGNEDKTFKVTDGFELQPLYRLPDGTTFFQSWIQKSDCSWGINSNFLICGDFRADVNGAAPPNIVGIDQFQFWITSNSIVPMGYPNDSRSVETHCLVDKASITTKNHRNGYGCAAWVIEKGTMPWLYGKQPKWDE